MDGNVDKENPAIVQYRWSHLLFRLKPSPAILGATIKQLEETEPNIFKILGQLYADNLCFGAESSTEALEFYRKTRVILSKGDLRGT